MEKIAKIAKITKITYKKLKCLKNHFKIENRNRYKFVDLCFKFS